jgi:hypothetical protein
VITGAKDKGRGRGDWCARRLWNFVDFPRCVVVISSVRQDILVVAREEVSAKTPVLTSMMHGRQQSGAGPGVIRVY